MHWSLDSVATQLAVQPRSCYVMMLACCRIKCRRFALHVCSLICLSDLTFSGLINQEKLLYPTCKSQKKVVMDTTSSSAEVVTEGGARHSTAQHAQHNTAQHSTHLMRVAGSPVMLFLSGGMQQE